MIEAMEAPVANQYFAAIGMIEAQEMLLALKVSDFPQMKSRDRQKLHRELKTLAEPRPQNAGRTLTTEDIFAALKGGMNGGR